MFSNRANYSVDKKTGNLIPINLQATNVTKCLNCGKQYTFDAIQRHLQTHIGEDAINQKFQHDTNAQDPLKLQDSLSQASTNNQIQTQTIMASDLPGFQKHKQDKHKPTRAQDDAQNLKKPFDTITYFSIRHEELDISSRIDDNSNQRIGKVLVDPSEYYESINIQQKKVNARSKQISIYTKQNSGNSTYHKDQTIISSKNGNSDQEERKNKYSIHLPTIVEDQQQKRVQFEVATGSGRLSATKPTKFNTYLKQQKEQQIRLNNGSTSGQGLAGTGQKNTGQGNNQSRNRNLYNDQDNRNSRRTQNWNSKAIYETESQYQADNCAWYHQAPKPVHHNTNSRQFHSGEHNHGTDSCYCPCCGGFYCPVCKSTIPPQFRRPDLQKMQNLQKSRATNWPGPS